MSRRIGSRRAGAVIHALAGVKSSEAVVGEAVFVSVRDRLGMMHEGRRYPETVRWAARRGAQVVFHPHADVAEHQPYGQEGLLVADLDLGPATGLLARRCRTSPM